jgi:predicted dithiol-disulfide oxidoreductase (DUF899 family)
MASTSLTHRGVTSNTPLAKFKLMQTARDAFRRRSSFGRNFNFDDQVRFSPQQIEAGRAHYNYQMGQNAMFERAAISVVAKGSDEAVYIGILAAVVGSLL